MYFGIAFATAAPNAQLPAPLSAMEHHNRADASLEKVQKSDLQFMEWQIQRSTIFGLQCWRVAPILRILALNITAVEASQFANDGSILKTFSLIWASAQRGVHLTVSTTMALILLLIVDGRRRKNK